MALRITGREAARRSGISPTRWRQVIAGVQRSGGSEVPANPRPRTVIAMARAVGVDERAALLAAGHDVGDLDLLLTDIDSPPETPVPPLRDHGAGPIDLDGEIERIERLQVSASTKLRLINAVLGLYEEAQREQSGQGRRSTAG